MLVSEHADVEIHASMAALIEMYVKQYLKKDEEIDHAQHSNKQKERFHNLICICLGVISNLITKLKLVGFIKADIQLGMYQDDLAYFIIQYLSKISADSFLKRDKNISAEKHMTEIMIWQI